VIRIATEELELQSMLQQITATLAAHFGWELVAFVRVDETGGRAGRRRRSCRSPERRRLTRR
jgi:hypothetical protein